MIEQYEHAVLEWFHAAYPKITEMVYGPVDEILEAKTPTLRYPCLTYTRSDESQVLAKAIVVDEDKDGEGKYTQSVMYSVPTEYEAHLYLNNERDLYRVLNVLRQKWHQESYVTLRYPDKDDQLRVAMRLLSMQMQTIKTGVNTKGPKRDITIKWHSDLFIEALYLKQAYTGYRVTLVAPDGGRKVVRSTCSGDKCPI